MHAEKLSDNTQKIEQEQTDTQNIERNTVSDNSVCTNDDLFLKKQYNEQNEKRSSLNCSSTSITNSEVEWNSNSISMNSILMNHFF